MEQDRTGDFHFREDPADQLAINTVRFLSVDAVEAASSGHPGLPLGAAPMAHVLWTRFLRHNPADPTWFDRDRFVLSAGHGSMLLYSLLHLSGYPLSLDDLKKVRSLGSKTPGHPERELTPGVEITTGPLGQGFGAAVGMAIAEKYLAARFNRPGFDLLHHYCYVLASDGDMMEGVASEAASLAGHLGLNNLICLYDDNQVTLSGSTLTCFSEDRAARFRAYGWHTEVVHDGNNLAALAGAILRARGEPEHPSLILVRTHIGYGSPHKQDTFAVHGSPLGREETRLTKQNLDWPEEPPFYVPPAALALYRKAVGHGQKLQAAWDAQLAEYTEHHPEAAAELRQIMSGGLPMRWEDKIPTFGADPKGMATRVASGKVLAAIAPALPGLIGGSADLNPSTHTAMKGAGDFEPPQNAPQESSQGAAGGGWNYAGRNLHFGVREHAMGAILNGLAVHGLIPFGATFLTFSDYMRPPMRLAALMQIGTIYVFTHDSLALGEDGPTHQAVEQLAALRVIPGLTVIRPADANETAAAWRVAIAHRHAPVALVLSRQDLPTLERTRYAEARGLERGAYVLLDPPEQRPPQLILIASGSEVALAAQVCDKLTEQGFAVRLVSMPSQELFAAQSQAYRDQVLPPGIRARLAVEAGVALGWRRFVGEQGDIISVEKFGASAPGPVVMQTYGFSVENVCAHALALLSRSQATRQPPPAEGAMRIGIAADHGGFDLKEYLKELLSRQGHEIVDFGNDHLEPSDDYPDFVLLLARAVADGKVERGIALCSSGVGAAVVAGKLPRVRAALIHDTYTAHQGVEHDDINLLCLGGSIIGQRTAREVVAAFLRARFDNEPRHRRRLEKIEQIERS